MTLFLLPTELVANDLDEARLRKAALLPTFSTNWGCSFSAIRGYTPFPKSFEGDPELIRLERDLARGGKDPDQALRLARIYDEFENYEKERAAGAKAEKRCLELLKESPDDPVLLTQLGEALDHAGKHEEAEKVLRRATELSPKAFRSWVALGDCLVSRACDVLLYADSTANHGFGCKDGNEKSLVARVRDRVRAEKVTEEDAAKAERLRVESEKCFNEALKVAPAEAEIYLRRAQVRYPWRNIQASVALARAKEVEEDTADAAISTDLANAVKIRKDDPGLLAGFLLYGCSADLQQAASRAQAGSAEYWDALSQESRNRIDNTIDRMKRFVEEKNTQNAADGCETLAILYMVKLERKQAAQYWRRAVRLDPTRQRAWDRLWGLMATNGEFKELVESCQERAKEVDDAHTRFVMAKAYERLSQMDDAEKQIRLGLKQDPSDFLCNLALAALLLRKANSAAAMGRAREQLDRVEKLPQANLSPTSRRDLEVLRALHWAISGEPDRAREVLRRILKEEEDHRLASAALEALEN